MPGLIGKMKDDVKKSGANKGKILYVRDGSKVRVRFLQELDDGLEVVMHDSFDKGINVICQEQLGKHCDYCEMDGLRTRSNYVWSVWDYDSNEVKLMMYAVNNCSPIPALLALNETYGTITDRDYVISVHGKQQNKQFSVVPLDKVKFRNEKAKPMTEKAIWNVLSKAFPTDDASDEDDEEEDYEEEEKTAKKAAPKKTVPAKKAPSKEVEEDDDDADWGDEEDAVPDYSEMSARELYTECKNRKIECKPKMPAKYYINLLEEDDKANEDWGDEDDDDAPWEDEE